MEIEALYMAPKEGTTQPNRVQSSDERRLLSIAVQKAKQLGVQVINPVEMTHMDVIRYHCDITVTVPGIYYSRLTFPFSIHLT